MFFLFIIAFILIPNTASPLHALFASFQSQYNKTYSSDTQQQYRFEVFKDNLRHITLFNTRKNSSYGMAMNQFGDLTRTEFKQLLRGYDTSVIARSGKKFHNFEGQLRGKLPTDVDWVALNKVATVKDQLYCGGCWAFAVADAVESRYAIKHSADVVEVSIQELIDCDHDGVNEGCIGGNLPEGYDYVIDMGGLCTDHEYTFTGYDQYCKRRQCKQITGKIRDYGIVIPNNELALKEAVAQGPVAIAIEADADAMQFYESGVLTSPKCGINVDHAVTIVGYGVDKKKGLKYWKIKNSWSDDWGEGGYMRLCRECGRNGKTGECGITVEAVFPIV